VSVLFLPVHHFCYVWFVRAHSRSNKLLGAGFSAAPSRMHLYPSQFHRDRLSHYSLQQAYELPDVSLPVETANTVVTVRPTDLIAAKQIQ